MDRKKNSIFTLMILVMVLTSSTNVSAFVLDKQKGDTYIYSSLDENIFSTLIQSTRERCEDRRIELIEEFPSAFVSPCYELNRDIIDCDPEKWLDSGDDLGEFMIIWSKHGLDRLEDDDLARYQCAETYKDDHCVHQCDIGEKGCSITRVSAWFCGEENDGDPCREKIYDICSTPENPEGICSIQNYQCGDGVQEGDPCSKKNANTCIDNYRALCNSNLVWEKISKCPDNMDCKILSDTKITCVEDKSCQSNKECELNEVCSPATKVCIPRPKDCSNGEVTSQCMCGGFLLSGGCCHNNKIDSDCDSQPDLLQGIKTVDILDIPQKIQVMDIPPNRETIESSCIVDSTTVICRDPNKKGECISYNDLIDKKYFKLGGAQESLIGKFLSAILEEGRKIGGDLGLGIPDTLGLCVDRGYCKYFDWAPSVAGVNSCYTGMAGVGLVGVLTLK